MVTVTEVGQFISDLGISKVTLKESDIEAILDTMSQYAVRISDLLTKSIVQEANSKRIEKGKKIISLSPILCSSVAVYCRK